MNDLLNGEFMKKPKLHEFFMVNIEKTVKEFQDKIKSHIPTKSSSIDHRELFVIYDPQYRRNSATVDMNLALKLYNISW